MVAKNLSRMKPFYKILIISGIGALAILGVYLGWQAITSGSQEEIEEIGVPVTGEMPSSPNTAPLKKLSENAVFDFFVNAATKEVFYFTPDGKVMNAKDGPDLEISKQTIKALNFIEVEPKNQKVLAAFGDPSWPQWGIFDVIDGVWRPLPSEIMKATWGENDEKLVAIIKKGENISLVEVDLTKTPPSYRSLIRDFRLKDVKITWVAKNRIIISELPSASYAGSVWQFDPESLNFNLLIAPRRGLTISWSENKKLFFLFDLDSGFQVLDENFQKKLLVPFNTNTLPEKCTADSLKVYCFVPQNIPAGTVLPDYYLTKRFYSVDDLIVLGVESAELENILTSNSAGVPAIDGKNPKVVGNKIYFINRYDNQLYELNL